MLLVYASGKIFIKVEMIEAEERWLAESEGGDLCRFVFCRTAVQVHASGTKNRNENPKSAETKPVWYIQ